MKKIIFITSLLFNVLFLFVVYTFFQIVKELPVGVNDQYNVLSDRSAEIVFVGDSITFGGNWHEWFPYTNAVNRGIGGDTTQMVLDRFHQVTSLKPKKLFLMIGVNDLNSRLGADHAIANYKILFDLIDKELPETKVYVQSVLPVNDDWLLADNTDIPKLNDALKDHAETRGYQYIDLHSQFSDSEGMLKKDLTNDGIHLMGKGYSLWHDNINEYVYE